MTLVVYRILINLIFLFSPIIILIRILKGKEDLNRFPEKLGFFSKKKVGKKLIWFHGASVGELLSVIPLIENLEKDKNINQILLTSSTISSAKVFSKFKFKKTIHQFFPIDSNIISKKFINFWKPSISIFIDSEIWPNMILNLKIEKTPIILLNARITKKSFKRWKILKNFADKIFQCFSNTYPCNKETQVFLKFFGVKNINLIDESYNSNPLSLKSAILNFEKIESKKSKKFLLIGDMLELGRHSKRLHKSIAPVINKTKINKVFVKGHDAKFIFQKLSKSKKGKILYNKSQIIKLIRKDINNNDYLMIKASNATGFNQIVKDIKGFK